MPTQNPSKKLMRLASPLLPLSLAIIASSAHAGVRSLTSDEMTETYIQDSTIIVTSAKRDVDDEKKAKAYATLTISPGEAAQTEAEEQVEFEEFRDRQDQMVEGAVAAAEEQARDATFALLEQNAILPPPEVSGITAPRPMPNIPGFAVPEGDFNYQFYGNQLGLGKVNDQLVMSFGNLPGIEDVNLPRAINEGPIQMTPRPGGGFDLIIDIPQN